MTLSIVVQNLFGILMNNIMSSLIGPDSANLKDRIGFIFGGTVLPSVISVCFRVLETAHRRIGSFVERKVFAGELEGYMI